MFGATAVVVVLALVCLAFQATRLVGAAALALLLLFLFYLHPLLFTALFALGGVALCLVCHYKRRTCNEVPKLPDRSD